MFFAALPTASEEFFQYKLQLLKDSQAALDDYFSITFDETPDKGDLILTGVPSLLPQFAAPWSEVSLALISFPEACPEDAEAKHYWIKDIALRLSSAFAASLFRIIDANEEKETFEYCSMKILPTIKAFYLCGPRFKEALISGSNNDLYKSFDRC